MKNADPALIAHTLQWRGQTGNRKSNVLWLGGWGQVQADGVQVMGSSPTLWADG